VVLEWKIDLYDTKTLEGLVFAYNIIVRKFYIEGELIIQIYDYSPSLTIRFLGKKHIKQ